MKGFFILLILAGLAYGGYTYYRQNVAGSDRVATPFEARGQVIISQATDTVDNLAAVLGDHIQNAMDGGKDALSTATGGQSDPIINHAVESLQSQMKDLPKETVDKVKYEFCRGVVTDYEAKKETL